MTWMFLRQSWWIKDRILAVIVVLRTEEMWAKGRMVHLSFKTMRSTSGTYSWLEEEREGTVKEKPWPERIWWVSWRTRDSIADWTEERERSDTSRHVEERERSASVKGFEVEEEEVEEKDFSIWRIWSSDLRRCLKGWDASSESE